MKENEFLRNSLSLPPKKELDMKEKEIHNYNQKRFYHKRKETRLNPNNSTNTVNNGSYIAPSIHGSEKVYIF